VGIRLELIWPNHTVLRWTQQAVGTVGANAALMHGVWHVVFPFLVREPGTMPACVRRTAEGLILNTLFVNLGPRGEKGSLVEVGHAGGIFTNGS
jgi:hypothetical protein